MDLIVTFINKLAAESNGLIILLLSCFLLGLFVAWLFMHRKLSLLQTSNSELVMTLKLERQSNEYLDEILDQTRFQLADTFNKLSNEALSRNNDHFIKLAEENLKRHQSEAKAELHNKEKAIEQLVKPINEALQQTAKQIHEIEKERKESYGQLHSTIKHLNEGQQHLQQETQNLVQALRRPEVRGQWGEMTLRRLAELSGMVSHCDFYEQTTTQTDSGRIRPDMLIKLPENRQIVVDAKTPLDAYLSSIQAQNEQEKQRELKRHSQIIRQRAKELSAKNYWVEYTQSPEFVVLFIPGEHFLSAALQIDPSLLEDTMQDNIILATPTNFIALLRAVSYGWKQQSLTENAIAIRDLGESLYKRLSIFSGHLSKLGANLNSSVEHFNKTVGSLEKNVIPSGKRFLDMGIRAKEDISTPLKIDKQARSVNEQHNDG